MRGVLGEQAPSTPGSVPLTVPLAWCLSCLVPPSLCRFTRATRCLWWVSCSQRPCPLGLSRQCAAAPSHIASAWHTACLLTSRRFTGTAGGLLAQPTQALHAAHYCLPPCCGTVLCLVWRVLAQMVCDPEICKRLTMRMIDRTRPVQLRTEMQQDLINTTGLAAARCVATAGRRGRAGWIH